MERLRFRSTSLADLQAELHERDLLSGTDRRPRDPVGRRGRTLSDVRTALFRVWRGDRP